MQRTLSSSEIRRIRSLSQKKFRDESGLFVVEGEKMVSEALASSFEVVDVLREEEIGRSQMERISLLSSPSPCLAIVRKPLEDIEGETAIPGKGLYLALDSIRDPGNLGTILRTADWFGVDAVYASGDTVELYNPKVVQSTMGAVFRVKFIVTELADFLGRFSSSGGKVIGTLLEGEDIYSCDLSSHGAPIVMVTGNESRGISDMVRGTLTQAVRIPSYREGSESLNASIATAVALSEIQRVNHLK